MTQKDSDRGRPPPSVLTKLVRGVRGTLDDLLSVSGFGGNGWEKIGDDEPAVRQKPDIVRQDDEEAFRQGWRDTER